jgi:hypothetical protein
LQYYYHELRYCQEGLQGGAKKAGAINLGTAYYEEKFVGPEDISIDVGHWQGAAPVDK